MGKVKYIHDIRELFKESPVVTISSLKRYFPKKNKKYLYLLIHNLLKKREIYQITKGYYTIYEDPMLAFYCFKPSYLGLQDALSIHNLWEQETIPIIITTRKVRQGIRSIQGMNVLIKRINKHYFFGFDYVKQGDFHVPVSDIEKTFIDLLYFKQNIEKEVLNALKKKIARTKLKQYLKPYPPFFKRKVMQLLERKKKAKNA